MIAITFALPAESSGLVRNSLRAKRVAKCGSSKIIFGKLLSYDVAIFYTGVGRRACARSIDQFLDTVQPKLLISSGFAGSVGANLKVGDIIVGENFSDAGLIAKFPGKAKLVTSASMIDSPVERNRIANESGASAVDMETEVIAKACASRGIRMLSLRVISDTMEEPFPIPVSILFSIDRQKTDLGQLTRYLLKNPGAALPLFRFSKQIRKARRNLESAILMVLGELAASH